MQMHASRQIVLLASLPPIKASKLTYYSDRNFIARVGSLPLPPPRDLPPPNLSASVAPAASHSAPIGRTRAQDTPEPPPQSREEDPGAAAQNETAGVPAGTVREQMARYFLQFGAGRDFET